MARPPSRDLKSFCKASVNSVRDLMQRILSLRRFSSAEEPNVHMSMIVFGNSGCSSSILGRPPLSRSFICLFNSEFWEHTNSTPFFLPCKFCSSPYSVAFFKMIFLRWATHSFLLSRIFLLLRSTHSLFAEFPTRLFQVGQM